MLGANSTGTLGLNHWRAACGETRRRGSAGPTEKARAGGTSPAAYPTLREPEGETPSGHSPCPDPQTIVRTSADRQQRDVRVASAILAHASAMPVKKLIDTLAARLYFATARQPHGCGAPGKDPPCVTGDSMYDSCRCSLWVD